MAPLLLLIAASAAGAPPPARAQVAATIVAGERIRLGPGARRPPSAWRTRIVRWLPDTPAATELRLIEFQ
ncbi:MAG: hypothetical protein ACM3YM_02450 [Sphingomonadales bacterium]